VFHLFNAYNDAKDESAKETKDLRNALILQLHCIYDYPPSEIALMFGLSVRYTRALITKTLTTPSPAQSISPSKKFINSSSELKRCIKAEVSSQMGLVTAASLQKTVETKLG